jgi:3-deoxy-manno-octulosonate cytidylyltransferase (CMP-KDO synthetase)
VSFGHSLGGVAKNLILHHLQCESSTHLLLRFFAAPPRECPNDKIIDAMTNPSHPKIQSRDEIAQRAAQLRDQNKRVVFTNGCFDLLHAGHVELLQAARNLGDFLVVGLNSDASVKRLKGETRPINSQDARAFVLSSLSCVDAVCIFEEDTPIETIRAIQPSTHVKGGDYTPEQLPEAQAVRAGGGEIQIVPLKAGFSTTSALQKLQSLGAARCIIAIPARYSSTRFPGKPLALLAGKTVIEHVVRRALQSQAERPILVATDDQRIASAVENAFDASDVAVVMTSENCATGTDRLAEAVQTRFGRYEYSDQRLIVVNVQGDEPFINPHHLDALMDAMRTDENLQMATLATPIRDDHQIHESNVVKVVMANNGDALYFSRATIPHQRDADNVSTQYLRHIGVYAYSADWLQKMAKLPPTPLEETEKLEQLRVLENGAKIRVVVVDDVVSIAIDTPQDLQVAEQFLKG